MPSILATVRIDWKRDPTSTFKQCIPEKNRTSKDANNGTDKIWDAGKKYNISKDDLSKIDKDLCYARMHCVPYA